MSAFLYYFRCRHCATYAVTAEDSGKYVRCNGCGGAKKYEFREPVATDHDKRIHHLASERGVLHLPLPEPDKIFPCVRCGVQHKNRELYLRPDGLACRDCYRAEEHPPVRRLTPEEVKAVEAARRKATRD